MEAMHFISRPTAERSLAKQSRPGIRELLSVKESDRDVVWLRMMLQYAVELEFDTIPPYLFAMWSIEDTSSPASIFILQIVMQEMLHMGIACNLLNAIGGTPDTVSPHIIEPYPKNLPDEIHPGLTISLLPISKELVVDAFMEIELPENGPLTFYRGQTYPTIGSFYTAIGDQWAKLTPQEVSDATQISFSRLGFQLDPIKSVSDGTNAIQLIKEQGEGTSSSPLYGPNPEDVSHYYKFGEIYHEHLLKEVSPGDWKYVGTELPFPKQIYPLAPIPPEGYEQSQEFNTEFSKMLRELKAAWAVGGAAGNARLQTALDFMTQLTGLATKLMKTPVPGGTGNLCPTFRYEP